MRLKQFSLNLLSSGSSRLVAMKATQTLCHPEGGTTEGSRFFAITQDDRVIFRLS